LRVPHGDIGGAVGSGIDGICDIDLGAGQHARLRGVVSEVVRNVGADDHAHLRAIVGVVDQ
jgi:hypothetical protein